MSQLEDIKAWTEKATPGPWFAHQDFIDMGVEDATKTITNSPERYAGKFIASVGLDFEVKSANAELIAAAPKLLAALEAVEALHRPEKRWMPYRDADCSYDTAEEAALDFSHSYTTDPSQMPYFEVCAHCKTVEDGVCEGECTRENGYRESLWPCPTMKVIGEVLQ